MSAPEKTVFSHYEKTRLRGKPFIVGAISFFTFSFLTFGMVWILLQNWTGRPFPPPPSTPPSADVRWDTKAPQLQVDPDSDLARLRQTEDRRLHALHWNDAAHSHATIPIEKAMKLMTDAATQGKLSTLLPPAQPATPLDLQVQKSSEGSPPQVPNP